MPLSFKKNKSVVVLGGLLIFHLVLVTTQVPLGPGRSIFEKAVFAVFSPFQSAFFSISRACGEAWKSTVGLRRARSENKRMERELLLIHHENRFLRQELALARGEEQARAALEEFQKRLIPARVIGVDAGNIFGSITINRGRLDGVVPNLAVCDKKGFLVGRTIEPISLKESRVQLITDEESGVSVIAENGGPAGILSGVAGRGECLLKYILATDPRGEKGQILVTTGHDGIFPPGIKTGVIVSVLSDGALFKNIQVRPFFRLSGLDVVAVIGADGS